MVNNENIILDEAAKKKIYKMVKMKIPDYVFEFEKLINIARPCHIAICSDDKEFVASREELEAYTKVKMWKESIGVQDLLNIGGSVKPKDWKWIAPLMGEEPFRPAVMINISPNWKGMYGQEEWKSKGMEKGFKQVIESYLSEEFQNNKRYTKWKYCLECGSEGDFLHAHIVAEINPKIEASMKTHINKGNHTQQLRKLWNKNEKLKGYEGALKGKYSIQRVMINHNEILKDKLKYLKEKNKEEGHRNLKDLKLVFGEF